MRNNGDGTIQAPRRWARQHPFLRPGTISARNGFTIVEVVIVLGLMLVLVLAAASTLTLLDRSSRRQAVETTAMEILRGKAEEYRAILYNPPVAPFTASVTGTTNVVTIALNKAGTSNQVTGTLRTDLRPISQGHLLSLSLALSAYNQPMTVRLQTLINKNTLGQP
jgi:prepilin-type N-terminal cleavage/methylation domain-containing protein